MGIVSYQLYRVGRRISRIGAVRRLLPSKLRSMVQWRLLRSTIDLLPDRRYMEKAILPAMVRLQPSRLLDVGVQDYSAHYRSWFPEDCEFWTLDLDPSVVGLGSPGRHIVGDALDLASHFRPSSLDIVVLNGPFGHGIDRMEDQERVVEAARTVLRIGGWLLLGWDRAIDGSLLVISEPAGGEKLTDPLCLAPIASFVHAGPCGLPARTEFADCSHVYDWFQRRV